MRNCRGRPLQELYDATRKLSEPEITPVLQGTCRIQGPVDEANYDPRRTDSGDFPVEGRCLLVNEKLHTRAEPGTCNICSAPCTSCLHLKRNVPIMESKIEDGFSHDTPHRKEDDSYSIICGQKSNYKSRECDHQQHESSETSNFLSPTSSHDSCFANFESKARFRVLITDDGSEDVKIPDKQSSDEPVKLLLERTTASAHSTLPSHNQTTSDLHHKTLSDIVDKQHVLECHGDIISSITGITNASTAAHAPHMESDNKNETSSIPSTGNLLARKAEKPVRNEALHDCHVDEIKESQNEFQKPGTLLKEFFQKNSGSSPAKAGSSPIYEHSEFHPLESDNSSHHNSISKERNSCSRFPAVEIPKCLIGKEESSLAGELVTGNADGQENTAPANGEIDTASSTAGECASDSLKDTDACMGTGIGMGSKIPSDDAKKASFMKEPSEKSNLLLETANTQVSEIQHRTTSDNEIEDDVKVCDICGDAGQEELLAICSRCSDGAEHTYCMQMMLDKLPEGDWLCEECQLKEETENQRVDKSRGASEMLEVPFLNEKDQSSGSMFIPKVLPNLESKEINSDIEGAKGRQSSQISTKRHTENIVVTSVTGNKVSEAGGGSIGITSPRKNPVLSCESSFSNLDIQKVIPANLSPSCRGLSESVSQPNAYSQASSGSNSSKLQAQFESTSGLLSKLVSSKSSKMPKVKQLIESVSLRQKVTSPGDSRKDELVKTIRKSASFKSTSSGSSAELANKTQSLDPLRAEYPRGVKQLKEINVINRKNSSISDCPSISPSLSASTRTPFSKVDITFKQHDDKSNKIPDLSNVGTDRGSNNAKGCKEVKKQSSFSSRTSGSIPTNGLRKSEDQQPCQPVSKENACASFAAADAKSCCDPDLIQRCNTPQAAESTHQDDKMKDQAFSSSSRQAASGSSRILRCQRCNETGHMAQFCAVDKLRMSAIKPSAERNLREGSNKNSKRNDVVEVTNSKPRPLKNIRSPHRSEEISISSADQNSEVTSKDFVSVSLRCPRNLPSLEGTADGQEILRSSADFRKVAVDANVKQKNSYQEETVCASKDGNINIIHNTSIMLNVKPHMQMLPGQASILAHPLKASIIPKLEFIWQGGFNLLRSGRHSEICDGLQAHPSTGASPKALEAAIQFPCIIQLEEVVRHSAWPSQFQENNPKEDNIALYFFAKDIESYKNNYSKLLENMLKNDLALRGNMDGAELLIFPSYLLPENSQRWNNLLFLWSVFRERKKRCLDDMPALQEKFNGPNLNMEPLDQDLPAPIISGVSGSSEVSSQENSNKELSRCERSPKRKKVDIISSVDFRDNSSSGNKDRTCRAQEYTVVKPLHQEAVDNKLPLKQASCSLPLSSSGKNIHCTCLESNLWINSEQSSLGVKDDVTWLHNVGNNSNGGENAEHLHHASSVQISYCEGGMSPAYSVSSYYRQGTEIKEKDGFMNNVSALNNDPQEGVVEIDHVSSRPNMKQMQSSTMEQLSHISGETILWKEEANSYFDEKEHKKKRKLDNGVVVYSREEILSSKLSSKVHPRSSSFINYSIHDETIPESSGSVERNFFAGDTGPVRGKRAENIICLLSDDEDSPESDAPDLTLALGGEKRPLEQDILPLLRPKFSVRSSKDKLPAPVVDDGDDISASLSLSLDFPALEKERTAKSVSKKSS